MATNDVSGRTARRLRLTLAKRIADSSELGDECKRRCRGIRCDKASDDDEFESGRYSFSCSGVERSKDSDDDTVPTCAYLEEPANSEDDKCTDSDDARDFRWSDDSASDDEASGDVLSSERNVDDDSVNLGCIMDDYEEGNLRWQHDLNVLGSSAVVESSEQSSRVALFEGSDIAEQDAIVALLSLADRHRLTYACIGDMLQLMSSILPMPNGFNISLHRLLGRFVNFSAETIVHKFCGNCSAPLYEAARCTKPNCLSVRQPDATFIEIPLQKQIAEKMQDENFYRMLQYRFARESAVGEIQDVYDGRLYTDEQEFFSCPNNISLTMNYDGAPKFRSSGMQVWPVQFIVNELPPRVRSAKEHILTGGIWCSCQKPSTSAFLEPIMESLKQLETQGVKVRIDTEDVLCRVKLLMVVADLPAKASVLNCNQYNGKFGCSTCEHEGKQVKIGRGSTRVYPYDQNTKMRSSSDSIKYADEAMKTKKAVYGVKGKSVLQIIPSFDLVKSVPVDYMHCVLLGLVRKLLSLWFDRQSGNSKNEWYIGNRVSEVDKRLVSIAPPQSVVRVPRSIEKHRQYWKAQECRNFLLYYVPATLSGILPDKFFVHTLLLVKSLRILLGMHITKNDLQVAHEFIELYVMLYEEYYGQKHCVSNLHLLTHLTLYVKLCGPLWTHSAFGFESFMGVLLHQTHSTHDIGNQMVTHLLLQERIKPLRAQIRLNKDCPIFLKAYLDSFDNCKTDCVDEEPHSVTGRETTIALTDAELKAVNDLLISLDKLPLTSKAVVSYSKVIVNDQVIQSRSMSRAKRSNSYTVSYSEGADVSYGLLDKLIHVHRAERNLALIHRLEVVRRTSVPSSHDLTSTVITRLLDDFVNVKETGVLTVIEVDHILMQCFNTSITSSCTQLTHCVNSIESIL